MSDSVVKKLSILFVRDNIFDSAIQDIAKRIQCVRVDSGVGA